MGDVPLSVNSQQAAFAESLSFSPRHRISSTATISIPTVPLPRTNIREFAFHVLDQLGQDPSDPTILHTVISTTL